MGRSYVQSRYYFAYFLVALFCVVFNQAQSVSAQDISTECYHTFGGWRQVSPAPAFHIEGATTIIDGKIYVFSGFADNNLNPGNRTDVYNIATDTWESVLVPRAPTPFASSHIQAAADGQFAWIAGGFLGPNPGAPTDETWRYDTINDVWQAGPPLPALRASGALVRHGRTLHYIGGLTTDRNIDQTDHWTLDLDNPLATWQVAPNMPQPRNHMQGVVIGDTIFVVGGQFRHDNNPQDVSLVSAFNVVTSTWETRANMPTERSHFEPATFTVNGRIMGFGGRNNQTGQASLNTAVEYNPITDTWREMGTLPATLIGPVGNAYDGYAILTNGGFDYNIGQQNTWITELVINCPQTAPRVIQLDMSKTGAIESGGFGAVGETVTWTVTVTNNGNSIENITVSDTIEPSLELISVDFDRNRGDVAINGQNIRLFVPGVNPGDTISFDVQTRILVRSLDGTIRNTVTMENTGESVTGIARVLPAVTALPATGETPLYRNGFVLLLGLIGILFGSMALSNIVRRKSL